MESDVIKERPFLTFGIITDVQYADCEDGTDYSKSRQRFYRNSLNLVKNAVNEWKSSSERVSFILQLGDLIDGKCKRDGEGASVKALSTALHPFNPMRVPIYHLIGNHELYNMTRSFYLTSPLNSCLHLGIDRASDRFYYTFLPHPKLRIVAIDSYEISLLGYDDNKEHSNYKLASQLLSERNHNKDQNDVAGLEGLDRRWAAYNGGVGETQLAWLSMILEKAQEKEENVIIMSHVPIMNEDKDYSICLLWNYDEVMSILHRYQCVIGVFTGHEHAGYEYMDDHGIQHITYQAVVETRPGGNCYATARLWQRNVAITGVGRVPSYSIPLRYPV